MPNSASQNIAENIADVQRRISEAASRAGRDANVIRMVAISKTFPAESIRAAYDAGLRDFGENRVQEFQAKVAALNPSATMPGAQFHLIGHLQSNKASSATAFDWVQTIDSERVARRLDEAARNAARKIQVLLQIKLGEELAQEDRKTGAPEPDAGRLAAFLTSLTHLEPRGLMLLPPYTEDPEGARAYFRQLRSLGERLRTEGHSWAQELSMGMSHDFPIAIEEGATMVRIGTAIFGARR